MFAHGFLSARCLLYYCGNDKACTENLGAPCLHCCNMATRLQWLCTCCLIGGQCIDCLTCSTHARTHALAHTETYFPERRKCFLLKKQLGTHDGGITVFMKRVVKVQPFMVILPWAFPYLFYLIRSVTWYISVVVKPAAWQIPVGWSILFFLKWYWKWLCEKKQKLKRSIWATHI